MMTTETKEQKKKMIIEHLTWDDSVNADNIKVTIEDGTAESFWEKHVILSLANATNGVVEVNDQLTVKPPRKLNDENIA